MKRAIACVALAFAGSVGALIGFAESAKGAERPVCAGERVVAGELERLSCDVVSGQTLDVKMVKSWGWAERCEHMGGEPADLLRIRPMCLGVDF